MSAPAAPPVPPGQDPGILSRLLKSVNGVFSNPNDAGLLGLAQGFGAASAPHMLTPVSPGQAFGMAEQGAQQYQQRAQAIRQAGLQNTLTQQALIPYQVMRTGVLEGALRQAMNPKLTPQQRAAAAYKVDSLMGWNAASDPTVANRLAQIKAGYQPVPQAPGTTITTAAKVANGAGGTAHGAVPEGATFDSKTGAVIQSPTAAAAIAANAGNKAGAAAAATLPYQLAQHYVTRPPGVTGGTLGPMPGPFRPVVPGANPAAALQRAIGTQVGLSQAAQGAGRPPPMPPGAPVAPPAPALGGAAPNGQPPGAAPPQARPAGAPTQTPPAQPATMIPGSGPPIAAAPPQGDGIFSQGRGLLGYQMTKAQVAQANQVETEYQKEAGDAVDSLAQVKELQAATHDFDPGQFAEARIKGLQWLNTAGLISASQMRELGSAQEGTKMSIQLQSTLVRSLGSREAAQVFATLGRGVPNLTLSSDGFQKMAAYMNGMARYKQARAARAQAYYTAQNVSGVNSVKAQFIANSNPAYFIIASAPLAVQREMVAQMGAKAHSFLAGWAKAAAQGWAPSTTAYASQP